MGFVKAKTMISEYSSNNSWFGTNHNMIKKALWVFFDDETEVYKHVWNAYECSSPKAQELWNLLKKECEKLGLLYKIQDIMNGYKHGYGHNQIFYFEKYAAMNILLKI